MFNNNRLKIIRKAFKISQSNVADKLNIKRETYTRYETGTITPPPDMVAAIVKLFGTTSDYLLNLSDDPNPPNTKSPPTVDEALCILLSDMNLTEKDIAYLKKTAKLLEMNNKLEALNKSADVKLTPHTT